MDPQMRLASAVEEPGPASAPAGGPPAVDSVEALAMAVCAARRALHPRRALLVGLSGIDGSGKSHLAGRLGRELADRGEGVAALSVDPWLRLPSERFDRQRPGAHFYERGLRLEEMFAEAVLPLVTTRRLRRDVQACHAGNAERYYDLPLRFDDIDIVVVEGIFIFKRAFRAHFDLAVWVDCGFATALHRALVRNQEGIPAHALRRDYETIYHAAQRLHLERDDPRGLSDRLLPNEERAGTAR